jgi:hypothetical protein
MNAEVPVEDAESVRAQRERLPLYTPRVKVFPKQVAGTIRRAKWAVLVTLLGIYYLAPWLRWDRGPGAPDQAFLIDMPARRAYFMWIEIWPHEVYYLAGLLMIGAVVRLYLPADSLDRSVHHGRALGRGRPQRPHQAR